MKTVRINSPDVVYNDDEIRSSYVYHSTTVQEGEEIVVTPKTTLFEFRTQRKVGKVGLMMVGWGANC
jgi:myo-inositol-1-phosphate synthase